MENGRGEERANSKFEALNSKQNRIKHQITSTKHQMKLCGLKAGVSLYRCVNIIHAGFLLTLKGEVFSGI